MASQKPEKSGLSGTTICGSPGSEANASLVTNQTDLLKTVLNNTPNGMALYDAKDLRHIWANQIYHSALESYMPPQFRGKDLTGLTEKEVFGPYPEIIKIFETVRETQQPYVNPEFRATSLDGQEKYWQWTLSPIIEAGEVMALLTVFQDVTEHVIARKRAEESETRYRGLFENIKETVTLRNLVFDEKGEIVDTTLIDANPVTLKAWGFRSLDEVRGKSASELFDQTVTETHLANVRKAVELNEPFTAEVSYNDRDYLSTFIPLGKNQIIVSSVDVTDIKKTQRQMEESERREHQRRRELEVIMDAVPASIWVAQDPECLSMVGNKATEEMLGLPEAANVSKSAPEAERPENFQPFRDGKLLSSEELPLQTAARTGKPIEGTELELRFDDGRSVSLYGNAVPLKDEEGRTRGAIGAFVDITDRKRAEEELKRSNEDLQQFAYVASHDLKEPIRMIASYLGLLERKYKGKLLDETADEYMGFALEGAERMNMLVNDLLDYSRVDRQGREFASVSMNEVAEKVIDLLRIPIIENKAEIMIDPLPIIIADKSQMVQLLQNLISNAIKFHGPKGPRIRVSAHSFGRSWRFSVQDNGIGISREYHEQIFQIFQRLHTNEEYPGTGVGLAIAKKIVERHGGRIWVESEEGKGSTFFFTILKKT